MSGLFTTAQEAEIDRRAASIASRMLAQALAGSHDRIVAAVRGAPVLVPIFHLDDIARLAAGASSGKTTDISDEPVCSILHEAATRQSKVAAEVLTGLTGSRPTAGGAK